MYHPKANSRAVVKIAKNNKLVYCNKSVNPQSLVIKPESSCSAASSRPTNIKPPAEHRWPASGTSANSRRSRPSCFCQALRASSPMNDEPALPGEHAEHDAHRGSRHTAEGVFEKYVEAAFHSHVAPSRRRWTTRKWQRRRMASSGLDAAKTVRPRAGCPRSRAS